jgi:hypothetical protein
VVNELGKPVDAHGVPEFATEAVSVALWPVQIVAFAGVEAIAGAGVIV